MMLADNNFEVARSKSKDRSRGRERAWVWLSQKNLACGIGKAFGRIFTELQGTVQIKPSSKEYLSGLIISCCSFIVTVRS